MIWRLLLCCSFVAFVISPTVIVVLPNSAEASDVASETRIIEFPKDHSLGAIYVGETHGDMDERGMMNQVGGAQGTLKVVVPPRHFVLFEANRRVFQDPSLLRKVSPVGVDYLKIALISMDDSEEKLCNRALAYVDQFKNLTELEVDRSDADDSGLAVVQKLKNLHSISCFQTQTNGTFFKYFAQLPELAQLNTSWCVIKPSNFKYLTSVPKLFYLNVSRTGLDFQGAKEIGKCHNLIVVRASENSKFDDACLKNFASLKKLQSLDVRDTRITLDGLHALKGLNLRSLALPERICSHENLEQVRALFPKVVIIKRTKRMNQEVKETYAPFTR